MTREQLGEQGLRNARIGVRAAIRSGLCPRNLADEAESRAALYIAREIDRPRDADSWPYYARIRGYYAAVTTAGLMRMPSFGTLPDRLLVDGGGLKPGPDDARVREALAGLPTALREVVSRLYGIGRSAESPTAAALAMRTTPAHIGTMRRSALAYLRSALGPGGES